jgi:hypothetical protein
MLDVLLHLHVCGICILADDNLNRLSRRTHYNNISSAHTTGRYYIQAGKIRKPRVWASLASISERMKRHSRRVCSEWLPHSLLYELLTRSGATSLCGLPTYPIPPQPLLPTLLMQEILGIKIVSKLHARINYNKCTVLLSCKGNGGKYVAWVKGTA